MKKNYACLTISFVIFTFFSQIVQAQNDIIYVTGSTDKIEQLVGDYDKERNEPTANMTNTKFKVTNTDLGVPFEHNGKVYVAFGDIFLDDRDPMAYTTDTIPEDGIALAFNTKSPGVFQPIEIPGLDLGGFGVPTEGVSWNNYMYLYATQTGMAFSALAKSTDNGHTFTKLYDVSNNKFINISLVKGKTDTNYPEPEETDIQIMFGSGTYRQSNVFLAYQRGDKIEEKEINYFAGTVEGIPKWSDSEAAAVALFVQPCVGELSVSYNKFIKKWILLYNCGQPRGINCRTADNPWGPWSDPFVIFEPRQDQGYCYFIHSNWEVETCDNVHDPGRENEWGGEYGPYQFETLAKGDSSKTTIYYTLSTWNPYTVVLMKSKLKYKDAIISGIGDEIKGSSNNRLKIYPNPANEKLTIEFTTKSEGLLNVRFYDLQGRNVLEQKINSHSGDKRYEIRTRGLQSGLYFIKVRRSDGSNLLTKRIQIIK